MPETGGVNLKKGKKAMEHLSAGMNWAKRPVFATRREKRRATDGRAFGFPVRVGGRWAQSVRGRTRTRSPFEPAKKEISTH
jgi:hypothetical protein